MISFEVDGHGSVGRVWRLGMDDDYGDVEKVWSSQHS